MSDATPVTVVVWGDSIAAAGWPQRAEAIHNLALNTGTPIRVFNEAVGGNPAAHARHEFADRVLIHAPDIVVVHFGANDLRHDGARGALPISTPEEFAAHLTAMLLACRQDAKARALALGHHRVRQPMRLPTGQLYADSLRHYSEIARRAAESAGADYLDMAAALAAVPDTPWTDFVCADGVHLSDLGLECYASIIASALAPMVREVAVKG